MSNKNTNEIDVLKAKIENLEYDKTFLSSDVNRLNAVVSSQEKIISKLEGKIEAYENVLKIPSKDEYSGLPFEFN